MDFKHILRWVAVLPGSILVGIIILFPLHWILFFTLTNFIEPYPTLPEKILGPGLSAWAMVVASYFIAPKFKKITATGIGGMWILFACIVFVLAITNQKLGTLNLEVYGGGLPVLSGIAGAVYGIFSINADNTDQLEN